jgi:single-stranded-DNA-specific exonuclease
MNQSEKRWHIAPRISSQADQELCQYSPIFRQVLFNRGFATADGALSFLNAEPPAYDIADIAGLEAAIDRIKYAIQHEQSIVIYGDFDADGVTSTVLMVQTLSALGANVMGYIPDRFDEGYGLNTEALDDLKAGGTDLVITVDCGIRAVAEAGHAHQIGLDLIITDHHSPGQELPQALAVVNTKQKEDNYPEKNLAGVGIAYKVACALLENYHLSDFNSDKLLDLVAIGTIADLVPLVGENRTLVRYGLDYIRTTPRQGVYSLLGASGIQEYNNITASTIGFSLGPRLNAAGRIASAMEAYHLLLTDDPNEAGKLAQNLDNLNRERQQITRDIYEAAEAAAFDQDHDPLLLFAADPEFNPGVVGLAASRLVEKYYRPAIVAYTGPDHTRASCRSIPEFHITHALDQCADLFEHFGGHAAAAGFTVRNEHLQQVLDQLQVIAQEQIGKLDLRPVMNADAEVRLCDLKPSLLSELDLLQPTGYGNRPALFVSRGVEVRAKRTVGREDAHLKLTLSDGQITYDAIAFRQGFWAETLPKSIDILYEFELNEFNGRKLLQLNIKDIQI